MKFKPFAIAAVVAGCVVFNILDGAFGEEVHESPKQTQRSVRVSALRVHAKLTLHQRREWRRLRRAMSRAPRSGLAATADVADPHPVPLPADLGDAWVTEAANGSVCTFIPDPTGGYGSSCATQADLAAGGAITLLGGAGQLDGQAVAVMVVPDGGPTPIVTSPDGEQYAAPLDGLGATLVSDQANVRIGTLSITVPPTPPN
jgi:hypothetical protein